MSVKFACLEENLICDLLGHSSALSLCFLSLVFVNIKNRFAFFWALDRKPSPLSRVHVYGHRFRKPPLASQKIGCESDSLWVVAGLN